VAVSRAVTGFGETEIEHWKKIIERPSALSAEENEDVQMMLQQSLQNSIIVL